jgi:hypothetical protein
MGLMGSWSCLGFGGLGRILCAHIRRVCEADAERFEKGQVASGEGPIGTFARGLRGFLGFFLNLVEADGGLEHEENIKTLFADVFDDACNVLRLRNGLVDRFAKFLDKVFDLLIQCHLRAALWFEILTAHRVFPAKVTGGNGIAGTSDVPSYS